jgi:carbamoyl-phosphate synthase small subunit
MKLILQDGTELSGRAFGAQREVAGEVVFNTGMTGYVEALTDPSYRGQILVMTWPLQGNYGVAPARAEGSLQRPFESGRVQVQGLVCYAHSTWPSHHSSGRSLGDWLVEEGVPALELVDTRALVRRLREFGTMPGWMVDDAASQQQARGRTQAVDMEAVARLVTVAGPRLYEGGALRILVVDIGCKDNIVRSLLERGATVVRVPFTDDVVAAARGCHGVVISNGPGDPQHLGALAGQVRSLFGCGKPVLGICMGNQVLAMAAGAQTYKLKYGHRSHNQPVQDVLTHRCYVTSQNHGYAVRNETLPPEFEPWFVNIHDGTNEGIRARAIPVRGVQFHPEGAPGPQDTAFVFDEFLRMAGQAAGC